MPHIMLTAPMTTSPLLIKICGLSTPETLDAALAAGADMVGFVFFPPSPRNIDYGLAADLAAQSGSRALKVALTVDADDEVFERIIASLKPDILQLHGKETPERLAALKEKFGLPLMKAIHISEPSDLAAVGVYEDTADRLLFDARPPKGAILPGGNGAAFDWTILADVRTERPWMLSGGLHPGNVAEALAVTHAPGIDVSSGVEAAPGVKNIELIQRFVENARMAARMAAVPVLQR